MLPFAFCSHGFHLGQSYSTHEFCCFDLCLVNIGHLNIWSSGLPKLFSVCRTHTDLPTSPGRRLMGPATRLLPRFCPPTHSPPPTLPYPLSPTHSPLPTLPYPSSPTHPTPTHPPLPTLPYPLFPTHPPLPTFPYPPSPTHPPLPTHPYPPFPYPPSPTHSPPTHPPLPPRLSSCYT